MSTQLSQAIEEMATLPIKEQEAIAKLLLDEVRWELNKNMPAPALIEMAKEALSEHRAGKTRKF